MKKLKQLRSYPGYPGYPGYPRYPGYPGYPRYPGYPGYFSFWYCLWILFIISITVVAIVALVNSIRDHGHWEKDDITGNIISKSDVADVEIQNGNDFIFHEKILHSGTSTAIEKIEFTPVIPFLPNGDDFIFGDQGVTYSRLQAGLAIRFKLESQINFPLLFEDGLQLLIQPFGVHISAPFFSPIGTFVASDERVKKNITNMDMKEGIENILLLQPKTYYYVDEFYDALGLKSTDDPLLLSQEQKPKRRGFISQQVETVLPNSVRETIFNLETTGPMKDFKDLRKEDIIVELVSSIHYMIYQDIIDIINLIDINSNQPFESYVDQFPQWANPMRICVIQQQVDKNIKDKALCACKEWKKICGNHSDISLCNQNHPLREKCNLI